MSKREATLMETAIAMAKHRKEHPGANLMEMMADAHARGLKSEVCGMCNVTYLACHCFVLCKENRCPMKDQGPPLLERLKYIAESPPREHGGFHPETVKTANDAIAVIKNPLSDDEKLLRYYEKKVPRAAQGN